MMAARTEGWAGDYVGLPFLDGGRSRADGGLDCWGLVRLVYAEQCGLELPSYGEIAAADLAAVALAIDADCRAEPWRTVERADLRPFDVVVVAERVAIDGMPRRMPAHVGIAAGAGMVLHVRRASAAALVPLTHPDLRFRLFGLYRHKSLACRSLA